MDSKFVSKTTSVYPQEFILLSGRSNPQLASQIATLLKSDLVTPISLFSDGEIRVRIAPNLRRRYVYIIQSTAPPVNDSIMELLFMIDAVKRSSAAEITAIIPYFGYSRQDRKEMPRVPISSSVVTKMITQAGADRILTLDIHSEQQQGFTHIPWDNLYGSYSLLPVIKSKKLKNLIIASPDKGGMTRATGYAKLLNATGIALVYKERDVALNNKSDALDMIGNVGGKDVLLVDDMLDTGGTIVHAAKFLKQRGANSVRVAVTHGIFSGSALENITTSEIDEIIVTDTIGHSDAVKKNKKITIISVAPLLAKAIHYIQIGNSISSLII
jgi:ribose-phosphate pyrophosphokinase